MLLLLLLLCHACPSLPKKQKKLSDVGFKMASGLLLDCGLPESRLWYATVKRGAHTLATVKAILHDLGEVRNMRKQNPGTFSD